MYLKLIDQTCHCLLFLEESHLRYYLLRKSHFDEDGFFNVFTIGEKYYVTLDMKEVNIFLGGQYALSRPIVECSTDKQHIDDLLSNTFGFF
ncbi:hypothetical protein [Acinetobacter calcoaceticus]|uniref:hypothetical protein n=1 Tax=Acinetobacter calcoaceticus TaxID=471 RepID=UPI0012502114|nr:hypothetical protein [Acinetobacter calcoaceticus]